MSDISDWSAGRHEFCQGSSTGWLAFVHWFVLMLMLQGSTENNQYRDVLDYKNSGTPNNCSAHIKLKLKEKKLFVNWNKVKWYKK